jgi:hypothetical protein
MGVGATLRAAPAAATHCTQLERRPQRGGAAPTSPLAPASAQAPAPLQVSAPSPHPAPPHSSSAAPREGEQHPPARLRQSPLQRLLLQLRNISANSHARPPSPSAPPPCARLARWRVMVGGVWGARAWWCVCGGGGIRVLWRSRGGACSCSSSRATLVWLVQ